MLIGLAAERKMKIDQMDAVTAFLQGDLEEEIYIQHDDGTGRVYRLNRAMYGLKQSGRQWNKCLDTTLRSFWLIKSAVDPCVYYEEGGQLMIAIYVDDFLIFWRDMKLRDKLH